MTAVIKSGSDLGISVRGFGVTPPPAALSAEAHLIAELEQRLEALTADLVGRDQELKRLAAAVAAARDEGHAQGVVEGRELAEDRSEALARTIAEAADVSVTLFRERLTGLESLVGGLAALALDRIVSRTTDRQDLIADTVRRAIEGLFAGSVVTVEVSREDFVDAEPLRAVVPSECEVHILEGLPSGACRLRLRMGKVDLDLQGQAARLRAILDPVGEALP